MKPTEILDSASLALAQGGDLRGTGYFGLVRRARSSPSLASEVADRVGEIDRQLFERRVRLRMPAPQGLLVLAVISLTGVLGMCTAPGSHGIVRTAAFFGFMGAALIGTHSLAHFLVGSAVGMRFTHVFLGGPKPARPGVKVDYSSYLKASSQERAVMHASGAVVTKLLPFLSLPLASRAGLEGWALLLLAGLGIVQIVTDILFSTKTSDWMKVRRELAALRSARHGRSDRDARPE